jgi:ribosomal protein S14
MNSKLRYDKKKRLAFAQIEISRRLLLYLRKNTSTLIFNYLLEKLSRKIGHHSRIQYRCLITGRSKSIHRRFGLSRLMIRSLLSKGILRGVQKSSW